MGCITLLLPLIAEMGFVLWLRGQAILEHIASRDPVGGTVYYVMLALFAIMRLLLARGAIAGQTSAKNPQ
jgi:type IV secretory pathway TrbD component